MFWKGLQYSGSGLLLLPPEKTTTTKTTGPSLNKEVQTLILVQPSHFINDVTEVQGGGGCDLSKFIWPISERELRWEIMSPDLGSSASPGSVNYF